MNPHRVAADSLRQAMREIVPPTGAVLTPQLTYRIKARTLQHMKAAGLDLTAHARRIKLEFVRPDAPNLRIPPELMGAVAERVLH